VLGHRFEGVEDLLAATAAVRGNGFAKAGLEAAFTDLLARSTGRSLREFHGGTRDRVEVGVSIGIQPRLEDLAARIEGFLESGYRRIKIKIKPGWDMATVEFVRRRFPTVPLMADANAAYGPDDTDRLRRLDEFGLMMLEQPFAPTDLVDHARLRRAIRTPVCLDESVTDPQHAAAAAELGSMSILNIKAPRVGGLASARRIHDLCAAIGIPVWCGGLLETGIGRAHNLALASLPGFSLPGDLSASARYYEQDVIDPPVVMESDGTVAVPSGPGLGFTVREERLRRYEAASRCFTAR
jgi:O-succinylbenzoate synthase